MDEPAKDDVEQSVRVRRDTSGPRGPRFEVTGTMDRFERLWIDQLDPTHRLVSTGMAEKKDLSGFSQYDHGRDQGEA